VNEFVDHSELQVNTESLLISSIQRSPKHLLSVFPACCVFNRRSLATALTVGFRQLSTLMSLLSGEYPATELLSTVNSDITPQEIGTSSIDSGQLSRFYLKTKTECSLRNVVFCNINRMVSLDRDRTMDNAQKHNIRTRYLCWLWDF
jgi:hypothetical protein